MYGININCSQQDFVEQILNHDKTIETRRTASLRSCVGKRVGIIRTGCGPAQLVGYMTIDKEIRYPDRKAFELDYDKHKVGKKSPYSGNKYGYVLKDVTKINPRPVTSRGIPKREVEDEKDVIKYDVFGTVRID